VRTARWGHEKNLCEANENAGNPTEVKSFAVSIPSCRAGIDISGFEMESCLFPAQSSP
jgi:hypothetical protein